MCKIYKNCAAIRKVHGTVDDLYFKILNFEFSKFHKLINRISFGEAVLDDVVHGVHGPTAPPLGRSRPILTIPQSGEHVCCCDQTNGSDRSVAHSHFIFPRGLPRRYGAALFSSYCLRVKFWLALRLGPTFSEHGELSGWETVACTRCTSSSHTPFLLKAKFNSSYVFKTI